MPASPESGKSTQQLLLWAVLIILVFNLVILLRVLRPGRDAGTGGSAGGPEADTNQVVVEAAPTRRSTPVVTAMSASPASTEPTVITANPRSGPALAPLEPSPRLANPFGPKPGAPLAGSDSGIHVRGKVVLVGTPPPEKEITPIRTDPNCGRLHPEPVFTRHYVVAADGGLANVFVLVTDASGELPAFTTSTNAQVLDQIGCLYEPYVIGVTTGQPLIIRNSDPFMHNVNYSASTTGSPGNPPFNRAQPRQGHEDTVIFRTPELFGKLACNVHTWMFAYIGVVGHPWFAVTDANGEFELPPGLPSGMTLHVSAIHQKAGSVAQTLLAQAGSTNELRFELSPR